MALRRDTVAKEAVHIAIGITVEGTKEILGYSIAPNESAEIWKELLEDFKEVYNASKLEEALSNLETFTSKRKRKYPRVIDILDKNTYLLTYFDYPKEVRHSIYSTNLIEGFNKQLKKKFKLKEQFPTETSMEKYLVSQFNQFNR